MTFQCKIVSLIVIVTCLVPALVLQGQDPQRFQEEVDSIVALNQSVDRTNLVLFTGSSSIRMWNDLKTTFPDHNVINLGFGGSEMADLLYYTDKLILQFKPSQVFIYEGDNDVSFGRTPGQILATADKILARIRQELPQAEVIFISPKPSVSRWKLKKEYEALNREMNEWTKKKKNVTFVDVWTPMLDKSGKVREDIFLQDNLHMNEKGYAIWKNVIGKYLR